MNSSEFELMKKLNLSGHLTGCIKVGGNKSDIFISKTSRAFNVLIHSRALLVAILCWLDSIGIMVAAFS